MSARGVGGELRQPSMGRRGPRIAGGRLVALAAVLVMASVGQCQLPQPKFPSLGEGPGHRPAQAPADDRVSVALAIVDSSRP